MVSVIPAYEPDEKLIEISRTLRDAGFSVVIVDDGSSGACAEVFRRAGEYAEVLRHERNLGKGAALKTAFRHILENEELYGGGGIITVDADGQHLIEDVLRVAEAWRSEPDAIILGSREFVGRVPLRSRFGNSMTRLVFAVTTGVRLRDTQTGLRAFSTDMLPWLLSTEGERYEYEMNQLMRAAKEGIKLGEVVIGTVYESKNASSHFHRFRDSLRIYRTILSYVGSSLISWSVDYFALLGLNALFCLYVEKHGAMPVIPELDTKLPAIVIARILSSLVNYSLNRRVVFRSGNRLSSLLYALTVICVLGLNYLLLRVMTSGGIPLWIAQIAAQLILYPSSFVIQRKFVFKERKNEEHS